MFGTESGVDFYNPELVGAVGLVVTAAEEVAIANPDSRKVSIVTKDRNSGSVSINSTPKLGHQVRHVSYADGMVFATAPKTLYANGGVYVFRKTQLATPRFSAEDAAVASPPHSRSGYAGFVYSRSDSPSIIVRDTTTYAVRAEIFTSYITTRIFSNVIDANTLDLYCTNESNTIVAVVRLDFSTYTFTRQDSVILPHSQGILDLFVRGDEILYVTRTHAIHYNTVLDSISFNYHDFIVKYAGFDSISTQDFGDAGDAEYQQQVFNLAITVDTSTYNNPGTPSPGIRFNFRGDLSAGDYEIEFLATPTQIAVGRWTAGGDAGNDIGWFVNHSDETIRIPFDPVIGGTGHVANGEYDSEANALTAYLNNKTTFTHSGGTMEIQLWDDVFTDNTASGPRRSSKFIMRQLTGQTQPAIPAGATVPLEAAITVYDYPNREGNTGLDGATIPVTNAAISELERGSMTGPLSRTTRNQFVCNPLYEEWGEVYATSLAPNPTQFSAMPPHKVIRTVNNTYISLDPSQGRILFAGNLILRTDYGHSNTTVTDKAQCHAFQWKKEPLIEGPIGTFTIQPIEDATVVTARTKDTYPYTKAVYLEGTAERKFGEGKVWNSMFLGGEVTVCAWVKPEVDLAGYAVGGINWQRILSNKISWQGPEGFHLSVALVDRDDPLAEWGQVEMYGSGGNIALPGDPPGRNEASSSTAIPLRDGNWHFICGVLGINFGRVYHNGLDVTGRSNAGLVHPSPYPLRIGRISGQNIVNYPPDAVDTTVPGSPDCFRGWLGEIRVYNVALPAYRILEIFNKTKDSYQ